MFLDLGWPYRSLLLFADLQKSLQIKYVNIPGSGWQKLVWYNAYKIIFLHKIPTPPPFICPVPTHSVIFGTSRVNNPFNFLGLYKTDGASGRVHIPARSGLLTRLSASEIGIQIFMTTKMWNVDPKIFRPPGSGLQVLWPLEMWSIPIFSSIGIKIFTFMSIKSWTVLHGKLCLLLSSKLGRGRINLFFSFHASRGKIVESTCKPV